MWTLGADVEETVEETLFWAAAESGNAVGASAKAFLVHSGVKERQSVLWDHIASWNSGAGSQLSARQRVKDFMDYWRMNYIEHITAKGGGGVGRSSRTLDRGNSFASSVGGAGSPSLGRAWGGGRSTASLNAGMAGGMDSGGPIDPDNISAIAVINYFIAVEEERRRMQQQPGRPSKAITDNLQPSVRSSRPATSLARIGHVRASAVSERNSSTVSLPPLPYSSRSRALMIELPPKLQFVSPYVETATPQAPDPQLRGLTSRGRMFSLAQSWTAD